MNNTKRLCCSLVWTLVLLPTVGWSADHVINAEARIFNPDILYVQPGDTAKFINMVSHDSVSVNELLPEGAKGWESGLGNNITLQFDVPGTYPYVCVPHIGFGMVGVIVVGEPKDIDAVMAKAQEKLQGPYRRLIGKLLKVQQAAKQK